jgi:hypothetical protein
MLTIMPSKWLKMAQKCRVYQNPQVLLDAELASVTEPHYNYIERQCHKQNTLLVGAPVL